MSWLNCEPKSSTRMVCPRGPPFTSSRVWAATAVRLRSVLPHTYMLGLLERLALGRDRRRDDHLHVLKLRNVPCATHAERRPQRTGEVLGTIVDAGGPKQDLVQRRLGADMDARAARQGGVCRRHAPVEALRSRLFGARQRCADHHCICTGRERFADIG